MLKNLEGVLRLQNPSCLNHGSELFSIPENNLERAVVHYGLRENG